MPTDGLEVIPEALVILLGVVVKLVVIFEISDVGISASQRNDHRSARFSLDNRRGSH